MKTRAKADGMGIGKYRKNDVVHAVSIMEVLPTEIFTHGI
jgi:hypothetical protein